MLVLLPFRAFASVLSHLLSLSVQLFFRASSLVFLGDLLGFRFFVFFSFFFFFRFLFVALALRSTRTPEHEGLRDRDDSRHPGQGRVS